MPYRWYVICTLRNSILEQYSSIEMTLTMASTSTRAFTEAKTFCALSVRQLTLRLLGSRTTLRLAHANEPRISITAQCSRPLVSATNVGC